MKGVLGGGRLERQGYIPSLVRVVLFGGLCSGRLVQLDMLELVRGGRDISQLIGVCGLLLGHDEQGAASA